VIAVSHVLLFDAKRNLTANEAHLGTVAVICVIFFVLWKV